MIRSAFTNYIKVLPIVKSKEIYTKNNLDKFHPEGLYSEVIFGPKNDFQCASYCGILKGRSYEGEICTECGVKVSSSQKREEQHAKIILPKKIILPIFKLALQKIFGNKAIVNILNVYKYMDNLIDPYIFNLSSASLKRKSSFSEKKLQEDDPFFQFPVYDIASLNRLYDYLCKHEKYSLLVKLYVRPEHWDFVFTDTIVVIPPESRPVIVTGSKRDIPDLSKFYKQFLMKSTSNYWDNFSEHQSEEYEKNIYEFQKIADEMFEHLFSKYFLEKSSLMKESLNGSTVEFSTRATIIPDPAIKPYSIGLPKDAVFKNFLPNFLNFIYRKMQILNEASREIYEKIDIVNLAQLLKSGNPNLKIPDEAFDNFLKEEGHTLRAVTERAPVLWRYNICGVNIEVVIYPEDGYKEFSINMEGYNGPRLAQTTTYQNQVQLVNTLCAAAFNFDFDGDNMSTYAIQSKQGIASWHHASLGNIKNVEFEHNDSLVQQLEHESVYAMWALTEACADVKKWYTKEEYNNLEQVDFNTFKGSYNIINKEPKRVCKLNDSGKEYILPYIIICLNKGLGSVFIKTNPGEMPKKRTKKLVYDLLKNDEKRFFENLHRFNLFLLSCSTYVGYCNPTFSLKDFAIGNEDITSYKDTLINEPFIGFHQNDILFTDHVRKEIAKDPSNSLHRVASSDARIKSVQLLKAASNNGIPTDINGRAFIMNQQEDLLTGHTHETFFMAGDSARVSLSQRQEAIPRGGELQRKFYWVAGFLKLARVDDCGSNKYFSITIKNQSHLDTLDGRYYLDEKHLHMTQQGLIKKHLKIIDKHSKESKTLIGKTLQFRNPVYCEQPGYKICDKCFGTKQPVSANLGAAVGSYISESIIQSVLRMHHYGGAFVTSIIKDVLTFIKANRFERPDIIYIKKSHINCKEFGLPFLKEFYNNVYMEGDIEINPIQENNTDSEFAFIIKVINPPYNDDSVKQLNKILQVIDTDRRPENLMSPIDMYNILLEQIILPNGILSIYVELIISLLYFDKNDTPLRYGGEPDHQVAIKNIVNKIDPTLNIYYNFNEKSVSYIHASADKRLGAEHMLSMLLKLHS